jgi:orotidine 5'-phosphate decarboxylase subfamily 2
MKTFFNILEKRVDDCSSLLCVGLDPHLSMLPEASPEAALEFCLGIVQETSRYAAAFKPNAAFFEFFGAKGWDALSELIAAIKAESVRLGSMIPIILDAKRGDIASTADAYAKSAFDHLGADCITLNPYLGKDSIEPFINVPEKGAFLLCKTSNPGSDDLQNLKVESREVGDDVPLSTFYLYEYVAKLAQSWNTNDNIGLANVRAAAPDLWFLSPGVGAQGGDLATALKAGLRKDGKGMLINVSRSIARAENPKHAAAELCNEILRVKRDIGI